MIHHGKENYRAPSLEVSEAKIEAGYLIAGEIAFASEPYSNGEFVNMHHKSCRSCVSRQVTSLGHR